MDLKDDTYKPDKREMTVGELKKIICDMPDDIKIVTGAEGQMIRETDIFLYQWGDEIILLVDTLS